MSEDAMLRCLETGDIRGAQRLWKEIAPHLPQPSDAEAQIVFHHARTQSQKVSFAARVYSHDWLTERGLPSGLPDGMRRKSQQVKPKIVTAVGIGVGFSKELEHLKEPVLKAMTDIVNDIYSGPGEPDPDLVRKHMLAAKDETVRKLLRQ